MVHFHLRREYKAGERRTPITPAGAKALIDAGHKVTVEKFEDRCFPDSAYEASGCNMVDGDSWRKGISYICLFLYLFANIFVLHFILFFQPTKMFTLSV